MTRSPQEQRRTRLTRLPDECGSGGAAAGAPEGLASLPGSLPLLSDDGLDGGDVTVDVGSGASAEAGVDAGVFTDGACTSAVFRKVNDLVNTILDIADLT